MTGSGVAVEKPSWTVRTATALWGRAEQQDFRSRVRGTLLGSALGAPVTGLSLDAIRAAHGRRA